MLSFVIVSHSRDVAEGARALAEQMTHGKVKIAVAGGLDDPDNPIGTDPMKVMAAIESVYSEDGVIVMMDLGSAMLSAETAIDFLDPDWQENIYLSGAPLIEGIVAATVQANIGATAQAAMREAETALETKRAQLGLEPLITPAHEPETTDAPGEALRIIVPNRHGLHARPAAALVTLASGFAASLTITLGERTANAASINQVATLGARQGDDLLFTAVGADADDLLAAVQAFADDNFGDRDDAEPEVEPTPIRQTAEDGTLTGIPASGGFAVGPASRLEAAAPPLSQREVEDPEREKALLRDAISAVDVALAHLATESKNKIGGEAGIFEAHRLILGDPDLLEAAEENIDAHDQSAAVAWWAVIEATAERYRALDDDYLRARAADVQDVGRRVLQALDPALVRSALPTEPSILVAADLLPSDTAQLDPDIVLGIITEGGGATSHSAIIARSLGIPAVVGVGAAAQAIESGQRVAFDGGQGVIWPNVTEAQAAEIVSQREAWLKAKAEMAAASAELAVTANGVRIEVAANIGKAADMPVAAAQGAEGVGLFRTEFLFMERSAAPSEDEQVQAYAGAAAAANGHPIIVRTLDVGGDKPISYLDFPPEENPFLGYRGIRYWLNAPEIAKPQLRAICRASAEHPIKAMFPMVGTVEEVVAAKALLDDVRAELDGEGVAYDADMQVGVMIEVPAAVMIANQLAHHVDFFSIGTNDLTQYVMAADRGNPAVGHLIDYFQPSVLQAIYSVATAARNNRIWAGMCGEMAGDPLAVPLLVGMGLAELSMSAPSIPQVKAVIRTLDTAALESLIEDVLACERAEAVRELLRNR